MPFRKNKLKSMLLGHVPQCALAWLRHWVFTRSGGMCSQMLKMFTNAEKCCEGWTEHVHKGGKYSEMMKVFTRSGGMCSQMLIMFTNAEKCCEGWTEHVHKGGKYSEMMKVFTRSGGMCSQMLKMFTNAEKCCEGWTEHVHKGGKYSEMMKVFTKSGGMCSQMLIINATILLTVLQIIMLPSYWPSYWSLCYHPTDRPWFEQVRGGSVGLNPFEPAWTTVCLREPGVQGSMTWVQGGSTH